MKKRSLFLFSLLFVPTLSAMKPKKRKIGTRIDKEVFSRFLEEKPQMAADILADIILPFLPQNERVTWRRCSKACKEWVRRSSLVVPIKLKAPAGIREAEEPEARQQYREELEALIFETNFAKIVLCNTPKEIVATMCNNEGIKNKIVGLQIEEIANENTDLFNNLPPTLKILSIEYTSNTLRQENLTRFFKGLTELKVLNITTVYPSTINNEWLQTLPKSLEYLCLYFEDSRIENNGHLHLPPNLRYLQINLPTGNNLEQEAFSLQNISSCPHLEYLFLDNVTLTGVSENPDVTYPNLKTLRVLANQTDTISYNNLAKKCPNLVRLSLLTVTPENAYIPLKKLEVLELSGVVPNDKFLQYLTRHEKLQLLRLTFLDNVAPFDILLLKTNHQNKLLTISCNQDYLEDDIYNENDGTEKARRYQLLKKQGNIQTHNGAIYESNEWMIKPLDYLF